MDIYKVIKINNMDINNMDINNIDVNNIVISDYNKKHNIEKIIKSLDFNFMPHIIDNKTNYKHSVILNKINTIIQHLKYNNKTKDNCNLIDINLTIPVDTTKPAELIKERSKTQQYVKKYINIDNKYYHVGILIAGNAGRPGGSLGKMDGSGVGGNWKNTTFRTQEESIVSSWIRAENKTTIRFDPNNLFRNTLGNNAINGDRPWGMLDTGNTISAKTIQEYDYTKELKQGHENKYSFSHAVLNVPFNDNNEQLLGSRVSLFFGFGPNIAFSGRSKYGSGARTKIKKYNSRSQYNLFRNCVKAVYRANLANMIMCGVNVAIMARVSGGIYAKTNSSGSLYTQQTINEEYKTILEEVLDEIYPNGLNKEYKYYFDYVIYP
jgi:hypothetical protein